MNKMNLKSTLLFFGIPGLLMFIGMQFLLPVLLNFGLMEPWAVLLCTWTPCIILATAILTRWYRSQISFSNYFWVTKVPFKVILISIGIFIFVQVIELFFSKSIGFLSTLPGFTPPSFYPDLFKPGFGFELPIKSFIGFEVANNYTVLFYWVIWIFINIGLEELLWRGYALPRMVKYFGKWAWLVNGLLWNLFIHFFFRWSIVALLPASLVIPYICQKTKSMWPGIIIHGLGNTILLILLIPSVFSN